MKHFFITVSMVSFTLAAFAAMGKNTDLTVAMLTIALIGQCFNFSK